MDCDICKEKRREHDAVPFLVHEADMARMERQNKKTWVLCVILAALLVISWAGFLIFESQFEYVSETTQETFEATADGNGTAINNKGGELNYGVNG